MKKNQVQDVHVQEEEVKSEGVVHRRYYQTLLDDPVLADGIHLSSNDKAVYGVLFKYTHKDKKVAYPSQALLSMQLNGMDKKTIKKSTDWLEYLGIITIQKRYKKDGSFDSQLYIFNEIPDIVIEAARLCEGLANKKEVEKKTKEFKKLRKEFEERNKENNNKEEKKENKKKDYSNEEILEVKNIAVDLGNSFKLGKKDIDVLIQNEGIEMITHVHEGLVKTKAKRKDSFLKALILFVKKYNKLPSQEETEILEDYLSEYDVKVVLNMIRGASKDNIEIIASAFKNYLDESVEKVVKEADFHRNKNGTVNSSPTQSKYKNKAFKKDIQDIKPNNMISDYSKDDNDEFYQQALRNIGK